MTTLFIDADACPVTRDAIAAARSSGVPVVLVANATQNLARYAGRPGVDAVQVAGGRDAADFAIIERLKPGDIVVTQDIGVAAMVLGRGARALSPRGRLFQQPRSTPNSRCDTQSRSCAARAGGRAGLRRSRTRTASGSSRC